jgi:hypothetical protein
MATKKKPPKQKIIAEGWAHFQITKTGKELLLIARLQDDSGRISR